MSLYLNVFIILSEEYNAGVLLISLNLIILILLLLNAINYASLLNNYKLLPSVRSLIIPGIGFFIGYDENDKEFTLIILCFQIDITWNKTKSNNHL